MSAPTLIAVTGSTGALGGRVAARLAAAGVRQRLVVRDPARAPDLPNVEITQATYDDPVALREAFAGTDAVFLGAAPDATFTLARHHWATEERLRERGLAYTALRDSIYLDSLPFLAGAEGIIRGPAGDGRVAMVARDDIADVAVAVLLGEGTSGRHTTSRVGPCRPWPSTPRTCRRSPGARWHSTTRRSSKPGNHALHKVPPTGLSRAGSRPTWPSPRASWRS